MVEIGRRALDNNGPIRENGHAPVPLFRPPMKLMLFIHEQLKRGVFASCSGQAADLEVLNFCRSLL
jgi:hypothetical protein